MLADYGLQPPKNGPWAWNTFYQEIKNYHGLWWIYLLVWEYLFLFQALVLLCSAQALESMALSHTPCFRNLKLSGRWEMMGSLHCSMKRGGRCAATWPWTVGCRVEALATADQHSGRGWISHTLSLPVWYVNALPPRPCRLSPGNLNHGLVSFLGGTYMSSTLATQLRYPVNVKHSQ